MKVFITFIGLCFSLQCIYSQEIRHKPIKQLLYEQHYDEAVDAIEDSLAKDSTSHVLYYQLGKAWLGLDNYPAALRCFQKSHQSDTSFIPSMKELGLLYDYMGQPKKAIAFFQEIMTLRPEDHKVMSDLARIYKSNGYYPEAIQQYLYLIEDFPDNYLYHKNVGECYLKKNYRIEAWKYFSSAHSLNPNDLDIILRLGNLTVKSGNYLEGIAYTTHGLTIDSTSIPLLKLNGYLHMLNVHSDTAIQRFEQCLALGDSSFFTNKYLGLSHYQKEEFDYGAKYLAVAVELDSSDVENYYYYASALSKALYKKKSIEAFEKLLQILEPPQDLLVDIYTALSENHSYLNQHEIALSYELDLIELDGNPIWYLRVASHYDYHKGDGKKAISYYQKFIDEMAEESANPFVEVARNRITKIREDMFFSGDIN